MPPFLESPYDRWKTTPPDDPEDEPLTPEDLADIRTDIDFEDHDHYISERREVK